jgi:hypothetical protein
VAAELFPAKGFQSLFFLLWRLPVAALSIWALPRALVLVAFFGSKHSLILCNKYLVQLLSSKMAWPMHGTGCQQNHNSS